MGQTLSKKNNLYAIIVWDRPQLQKNFNILRKGYPQSSWSQQTKGKEFREAAKDILKALTDRTLNIKICRDPTRIVVLMPWRSGLAFGKSYRDLGISRFYHLNSKRDEKTLRTVVDYEYGPRLKKNNVVIIADPMLATGNTILDAVQRVRECGLTPKNIIINSVVSAPIGIARIKRKYPAIRIITGVLDKKLNSYGFIVPGLGDFGDKYFAEMSRDELETFIASFQLPPQARQKLKNRLAVSS